jgi:uncharacterized protein YwqG
LGSADYNWFNAGWFGLVEFLSYSTCGSAAELKAGSMDWHLLLQVDSEQAAGMMWGDVGRLYYWIRSKDLKAGNFDNVWLVLQCC